MRHAVFATSALAQCLLILGAPVLVASSQLLSAPAAVAQTVGVDVRVDRLEKEMRAVQRKVFPAGTPVEPEITRPATPRVAPGSAASTPVADLTARVGSLESQMASMTGQIEENSYKLKQLEDAFARYKADADSRLSAPDAQSGTPTASAPVVDPAQPRPAGTKPVPAKPVAGKPAPAVPAGASDERKAAVAAVEKPDTGDAGQDAYTYGYRLWDGKFYPEAQAQLKATVEKFGAGSVGSRAQNLLGRAYLDDGKPALASVAFYENYQKRPRGDRASDSLAYLGEALIQLKKPADACKVYEELDQVYGATMTASVRGVAEKGKAKAKCSG